MPSNTSFWSQMNELLSRVLGPARTSGALPTAQEAALGTLAPLTPRVLMLVYDPIVDPANGRRLVSALGWTDPDQLAAAFISDINECSGGLVQFQLIERRILDEIPVKLDGFRYNSREYYSRYRGHGGFHDPDGVNYNAIIDQFNLLQVIAANQIDEVWLFGGPYFGFYESTMGGAGAFFCNGPIIPGTGQCPRRFLIMGFNYERGIGEMLEDLGHRAESIMRQVYANNPSATNLFERFALYNQVAPGAANVGLMHFAPNSLRDYDWGNPTQVPSCCDDWYHFPNLPQPPNFRPVNSRDWGNGDMRLHHKWWFKHLPRAAGVTAGVSNCWWNYIVDPNRVVPNGTVVRS